MSTTTDNNPEPPTTEINLETSPDFEKSDIDIPNQNSDKVETDSKPDQQQSSQDEESKSRNEEETPGPETPTKEDREETYVDPLEKKPYKLFLGGLPGHTNKGRLRFLTFFRSFDQLFRTVWQDC